MGGAEDRKMGKKKISEKRKEGEMDGRVERGGNREVRDKHLEL